MSTREELTRLAEKFLRQGRVEDAIAHYQSASEMLPVDWGVVKQLADLLERAGQREGAAVQFCRWADYLFAEGFNSKAAALYKKVLKLEPAHEHALWQLAEVSLALKLKADARAAWQRVIDLRRRRHDTAGVEAARARLEALDGGPTGAAFGGLARAVPAAGSALSSLPRLAAPEPPVATTVPPAASAALAQPPAVSEITPAVTAAVSEVARGAMPASPVPVTDVAPVADTDARPGLPDSAEPTLPVSLSLVPAEVGLEQRPLPAAVAEPELQAAGERETDVEFVEPGRAASEARPWQEMLTRALPASPLVPATPAVDEPFTELTSLLAQLDDDATDIAPAQPPSTRVDAPDAAGAVSLDAWLGEVSPVVFHNPPAPSAAFAESGFDWADLLGRDLDVTASAPGPVPAGVIADAPIVDVDIAADGGKNGAFVQRAIPSLEERTLPSVPSLEERTLLPVTALEELTLPSATALEELTLPPVTAIEELTLPPVTALEELPLPSATSFEELTLPSATALGELAPTFAAMEAPGTGSSSSEAPGPRSDDAVGEGAAAGAPTPMDVPATAHPDAAVSMRADFLAPADDPLAAVGELQPRTDGDQPVLPPTLSVSPAWLDDGPASAPISARRGPHPDDAYLFEDDAVPALFVSRGRPVPPPPLPNVSLVLASSPPVAGEASAAGDDGSRAGDAPDPVADEPAFFAGMDSDLIAGDSVVPDAVVAVPFVDDNDVGQVPHESDEPGRSAGGGNADAASVEASVDEEIDLTQLLEDLRQWDTVLPDPPLRGDMPAEAIPSEAPADDPPDLADACEPVAVAGALADEPVTPAPVVAATDPVVPEVIDAVSAPTSDEDHTAIGEASVTATSVATPGEGSVDLDAVFADLQRQTDTRLLAEQQLAAGRVFLAAGLLSEAARAFERASLEPRQRFAAAQALAELHKSRGQLLEAVSWYEQASMAPVPDAAPKRAVLYDLAESLEALGETDRALGVLLDLLSQVEDYRDARARLDRLLRVDAGG